MPNTCHYDRARLGALLPTQHGVIARWQALECGLTPKAIDYRLRPGGPWRAMLPGVYLAMTGTPTPEQRDMAALLYAGSHSVITGAVAVRRHHLSCAGLNLIDVLIPADVRRRIQRTTRMPEKVYKAGPIRFVAPHRAVADAARTMTSFGDVQAVVCAALQWKRCALPLLIEELNPMPGGNERVSRVRLIHVSITWKLPTIGPRKCATIAWKAMASTFSTGCPALSRPSRGQCSPTSAGRSPQDTRGRSCPSSRWSTANTTGRKR